jgi:hypothetical protein
MLLINLIPICQKRSLKLMVFMGDQCKYVTNLLESIIEQKIVIKYEMIYKCVDLIGSWIYWLKQQTICIFSKENQPQNQEGSSWLIVTDFLHQ